MMKIYGKVTNSDLTSAPLDVSCEDTCFDKEDCILAFMDHEGHCILYLFNETETLEVVEANEEDGVMVAFKTTLPTIDDCPLYDSLDLSTSIGEDPVYWTKTGNKFTYKKCVGDWKMFKRQNPQITVCIQAILLKGQVSRITSKEYCEAMGYKLSGLASVEEVKWVLAKILDLKPDMDNWQGFWIDGQRECDECPDFYWTDGYTEGDTILTSGISSLGNSAYQTEELEGCLSVANIFNAEPGVMINDAVCDNDPYQWGVVCGYRLL
ncbi:hypothetical protein CAEBREN_03163 [Caenorhabditis brenneri]|uniref:PAN-3 domain-containing protein n=1 Tax=Caenorhabditis brenneri TaxID=135651 RepID=G0N1N7_CAEBE|nr:hypothetical protein CAEBREN_03163 [Caenorhabditis brenneri]